MPEKIDFSQRIKSTKENPPYLKALFYGNPGVGKTVLAGTAPAPLFIDSEHGSRSLLNHPGLGDIPVLRVTSFDEVEQLMWHLKEGGYPDRETVVIDSLSELQRKHMDEILRDAAAKDRNRNPYLPFQNDYKLNTEVLGRLVVAFRDLERNLVITAHVTEQQDEDSGVLIIRPGLTPKVAQRLTGIMDVVGYMTLGQKKGVDGKNIPVRLLQVYPDRRVIAKTRIGGLPFQLENPTFSDLLKANQAASDGQSAQAKEISNV